MSTFDEFEEKDYGKLSTPILRRLLLLLKPHWRWVAGFLLSIALVSIIDAYTTYLSSQIIDEGIRAGSREAIVRIVLIYGGVMLFQRADLWFYLLNRCVGERALRHAQQMFNHLQSLSLSYFSKTPVG